MIDKRAVLALLHERLQVDLRNFTTSQNAAQEGATHEETRQEDSKDTRAIEAQYLARGLAERVELMRNDVALLAKLELAEFGPDDPIELTALIGVEDEHGEEAIYFLVPCAGGESLEVDGRMIRTLTPQSPLGESLIDHCVDDQVTLGRPGRRTEATICWVV